MMHRGGADFIIDKLCTELANRGYEVTLFTGDRFDYNFWGTNKKYSVIEAKAGEQFYIEKRRWRAVGKKLARHLDKFDLINLHNTPSYFYLYYAKMYNPRINAPAVWYCHEPFRFFYRNVTDSHSNQQSIYDILTEDINLFDIRKTILKIKKHKFRYPLVFLKDNILLPQLLMRKIFINLFPALYNKIVANKIKETIALDKKIVRRLDLTLCNSNFTADNARKIYNIPAAVCYLGHTNNVNKDEICYDKFFLTASRLDMEKNNIQIVKAVHNVHKRNKLHGYKYVLIGKAGTASDEIIQYIRSNHLEEIIDLRGFVTEEEKDLLYKKMAFSIYIPYDEPFGLVPFESFSYMKTIITSNHGGLPESIDNMVNGMQVNPDDLNAIEKAIIYLIENEQKQREMGEAGFQKLSQEFLFSRFVDRFILEIAKWHDDNVKSPHIN
jgi:glycosyltransferase involved in cell wall biosynthesis